MRSTTGCSIMVPGVVVHHYRGEVLWPRGSVCLCIELLHTSDYDISTARTWFPPASSDCKLFLRRRATCASHTACCPQWTTTALILLMLTTASRNRACITTHAQFAQNHATTTASYFCGSLLASCRLSPSKSYDRRCFAPLLHYRSDRASLRPTGARICRPTKTTRMPLSVARSSRWRAGPRHSVQRKEAVLR